MDDIYKRLINCTMVLYRFPNNTYGKDVEDICSVRGAKSCRVFNVSTITRSEGQSTHYNYIICMKVNL